MTTNTRSGPGSGVSPGSRDRPRLVVDGAVIAVRPGETVLDAMLRGGLRYPWVCKRGRCAACKVWLISGEVRYTGPPAARRVFSEEERAAGVCLSCTAVPVGDVTVSVLRGDHGG